MLRLTGPDTLSTESVDASSSACTTREVPKISAGICRPGSHSGRVLANRVALQRLEADHCRTEHFSSQSKAKQRKQSQARLSSHFQPIGVTSSANVLRRSASSPVTEESACLACLKAGSGLSCHSPNSTHASLPASALPPPQSAERVRLPTCYLVTAGKLRERSFGQEFMFQRRVRVVLPGRQAWGYKSWQLENSKVLELCCDHLTRLSLAAAAAAAALQTVLQRCVGLQD